MDKKEIMRLTMLVEEMKASSLAQGTTLNPLVEKQREADRREIVRLKDVIDNQMKTSKADAEEIARLVQLLQETKHTAEGATAAAATAATAASSSSAVDAAISLSNGSTVPTAEVAVEQGEEDENDHRVPGNENGTGTTSMALLLAERKAEEDKHEIERLSLMLDETLALLNETNQERAVAEEYIVELRGKVDSVRDVVINESTVRATEAQLMVLSRQYKEVNNNDQTHSFLTYYLTQI